MISLFVEKVYSDMHQAGLVINEKSGEAVYYDSLEVIHSLTKSDLLDLSKLSIKNQAGFESRVFMFDGCVPDSFWFLSTGKKAKEILQYEVEINFINRVSEENDDSDIDAIEPKFSDYEHQLIVELMTEDCDIEVRSLQFDGSTYFDHLVECANHFEYDEAKLFLLSSSTIAQCSLETYDLLKKHFLSNELHVTSFEYIGGAQDDETMVKFSDGYTTVAYELEDRYELENIGGSEYHKLAFEKFVLNIKGIQHDN
jgi:hypothetical protein